MIVWGGWLPTTSRNGARYAPATDTWTAMSDTDPDSFREQHTAVWTGAEMIVWGGSGDLMVGGLTTGRIYYPATDSWALTASSGLIPRLGPQRHLDRHGDDHLGRSASFRRPATAPATTR